MGRFKIGIALLMVFLFIIPGVKCLDLRSAFDGNILYVGGGGPGNYSRIQDAIDNASDGDMVFVYDDSSPYYENVIVDKSIILVGEDKNTTVIDGGGNNDVVFVSADCVNVTGFTIQNSGATWGYAGIKALGSRHVSISDNIVKNNLCYGVYIKGSSGVSIFENTFCQNNYGIYVLESSDVNVLWNTVVNNEEGVYVVKSCDNLFSGNTFMVKWTGLHLHESNNNIISRNTFMENGDGIYFSNSSKNVVFMNVIVDDEWFGIWFSYSSDNVVIRNTISNNDDIGVYLHSSSDNRLIGNAVLNNDDGVYIEYSSGNIMYNNYLKNLKLNAFFVAKTYSHCRNLWYKNYWDRPRWLPYIIPGKIKLGDIHFYWFNFDWDPIIEPLQPYNIPGALNVNNVLYVGGEGPGNYSFIQEAIDAALPGDTVFVYNGTYYENVVVDKQITLLGEDRNSTVIDAQGYGDVITVSADGVTVGGFSIENGHFGVRLENVSDQVIEGNNIVNNLHGISLWRCHIVDIIRNAFIDNQYGIRLYSSSSVDVCLNNFRSYKLHAYFIGTSMAHVRNSWRQNYWGKPRLLPYPIFGKIVFDNLAIRWVNLDWRPLTEPC